MENFEKNILDKKITQLNPAEKPMEHLAATLEKIDGQAWMAFQEHLASRLTPDEVASVSTATDIVKSFGSLTTDENKTALMQRAANRLQDIATARKLVIASGAESASEATRYIAHTLEMLFNAAGAYASAEAVSESAVILGGMTPQEVEEARERVSRTNVS